MLLYSSTGCGFSMTIFEEYLEDESKTQYYCSTRGCRNIVFTVKDDRDGLNWCDINDMNGSIFCVKCLSKISKLAHAVHTLKQDATDLFLGYEPETNVKLNDGMDQIEK